jgi:hypothetical protein
MKNLNVFFSGILFFENFVVIITTTNITFHQFVLFFLSFIFIFFACKAKNLKNEMILQVLRIA